MRLDDLLCRALPPALALLASLQAPSAHAELLHNDYKRLQRIEGKKICVSFAHKQVPRRKSATNGPETLECRIMLWPALAGKDEQAFATKDEAVTSWGVFPLGVVKEACFDFAERLLPGDVITDVGRLNVRCAPESVANEVFAKAKDRPKRS